MNKIFISYCHAEVNVIKELINHLSKDHNLWIDHRLEAGEKFDDVIINNIDDSDVFLLFLSYYYADSDYCLKELNHAISNGKYIIPIALDSFEVIEEAKHGKGMLKNIYELHTLFLNLSTDFDQNVYEQIVNLDKVKTCYNPNLEPIRFPDKETEFTTTGIDNKTSKYVFYYKVDGKMLDLIGRENELEKLRQFINHEEPCKWCMVVGSGGSGKSRLCFELAKEMHSKGWDVHYLSADIKESPKKLQQRSNNNRLIIIDYPCSHSTAIIQFMKSMISMPKTRFKLRLILIERDTSINIEQDYYGKIENKFPLLQYEDLMQLAYDQPPYINLKPMDQQNLASIISQYTNKVYQKTMDDVTAIQLASKLAEIDPETRRPLYAIFIAEAWASNPNVPSGKTISRQALEYVLQRERSEWFKLADLKNQETYNNAKQAYFLDQVAILIAYATLHKGISLEQLQSDCMLQCTYIETALDDKDLEKYLHELGFLYYTDECNVAAFKPDVVGEYIVLKYL